VGTKTRLSKKQLKQDKFVSTTFELAEFLQEHTRKALIGLVIVVVLAAATIYYMNYSSHRETRAINLLMNGQTAYEAENYPLAVSDLERLRQEFSDTRIGDEAMFMLADAYFQMDDFERSRDVLYDFFAKHSNSSPFSHKAYAVMGCALENLTSYKEAADSYIKAAENARFDFQRVDSRIDAARAFLLAGNKERALQEYQHILDTFPEEQETSRVAMLMAEIEANPN
jgi:outer membrane protein assembly factor BamD (BamD/ComL family)